MTSPVVAWAEVQAYFREVRERVIGEMAFAENERAIWAAQGKLALIEEFLTLPETFAILAQQEEDAKVTQPPIPVRARVTKLLGASNAERLYGKDHGSQAEVS